MNPKFFRYVPRFDDGFPVLRTDDECRRSCRCHMVDEVRRQFREIKGILTGEAEPDYERCVAISTKGAQREWWFPR